MNVMEYGPKRRVYDRGLYEIYNSKYTFLTLIYTI